MLNQIIDEKYDVDQQLQNVFNQSNFVIQYDSDKIIYIDVDAFKQKKFRRNEISCKKRSDDKKRVRSNERSVNYVFKQIAHGSRKEILANEIENNRNRMNRQKNSSFYKNFQMFSHHDFYEPCDHDRNNKTSFFNND